MERKKHKAQNKKKNNKKREFNLYPAIRNTINGDRYGYINKEGNIIIPFKFTNAYDFNNYGIAIVEEDKKFGLIDTSGIYVVKPKYESINPYKEGRAIYILNSKMGVLDEKGNEITGGIYDYLNDYNNSRAVVGKKNDIGYKYGYIDLNGKEIIEAKYKQANDFNDGFGLIKIKNREYALIDLNGDFVHTYNYEYVGEYSDGFMAFSILPGEPYGYINKVGEIVIAPIYSNTDKFNDGVAIISERNGPYGVIDKNGKAVYGEIYINIKYLGEGKLALGLPIGNYKLLPRSIYAIGDTDGVLLTKFKYLEVGNFNNGLSYGSDEKKTFFIDETGGIKNDLPIVDGSGELRLKSDLIFANIDYSPYYLDKAGKIIYEPNKKVQLNDNYLVIIYKYKPNINYLIYMPEVNGMKDAKIQEDVNLKLKKMSIFKPPTEKKTSKDLVITSEDILNYDYYGDFKILFYKNDLLILDLIGYYYPLGAAHGQPTRKTPSINLVTGKFYKLEDLFKGNVFWRDELNKIISKMIENDPQYEYVFKDSFKGITKDQGFYLDENNLYIYYPPYEIGPYSAGFITFKIPFSDIDMILNKESDFYKSFNG